jgi:hypothetical protein
MPEFDTPESISVIIELAVGNVRIAASERTDTVVEVRPTTESDDSDMEAAGKIRVDHTGGVLRITGPKTRMFDFSRRTRSVDVSIALPAGSRVTSEVQIGEVRCVGPLGECRIKTSLGNLAVERAGPARLATGFGSVTAESIAGDAEIATGSGTVEIGEIVGSGVVKNSNGATTVEAAGGDLRVRNANGDIRVGRAGAGVDAKTSFGAIRVGEVVRGQVVLGSAAGDLEIGVAEGTAAWLDVTTGFGRLHNLLADAVGPDEADETVEVRGRTSFGDITIQRKEKGQ